MHLGRSPRSFAHCQVDRPRPTSDAGVSDYLSSICAVYRYPAAERLLLSRRIDRIFLPRTGFVTLGRLLARLHANKA